jgi:hypothetical protein
MLRIAGRLGCRTIRHNSNLGKGEALKSLVKEALKLDPSVVISLDADGQHSPNDIPKVTEPIKGEADIAVGVRKMQEGAAPRHRVVGNKMPDAMTSAKAGKSLHDTQSGFRAYSMKALERIEFKGKGMAAESQTLIDAASSVSR